MKNKKLANDAKAYTADKARKFALSGIKFAGKGLLTGAELAGKGVKSVADNKSGRKLLSKVAIIAACVAMPSVAATFLTGGITATALKYVYDNIILGKTTTALQAAESVTQSADKVLEHTLAAVSIPLRGIGKGIEDTAKFGKNALDKKENTMEENEEEQR